MKSESFYTNYCRAALTCIMPKKNIIRKWWIILTDLGYRASCQNQTTQEHESCLCIQSSSHGYSGDAKAFRNKKSWFKDISPCVATGQRKNTLPETNISPPRGKGTSSTQNCQLVGDMYGYVTLVPWREYISNILQQIRRSRTTTC